MPSIILECGVHGGKETIMGIKNKIKMSSKKKIIAALCCMAACIGLLFCYRSIVDTAVDSWVYYDSETNFHYFSGLGKPVSCIVYMSGMIVIIVMLWIVLRQLTDKKTMSVFSFIKSCAIYIVLIGMITYELFNLDISHIIVSDRGFYIIDNLLVNSEFSEYSYDYFEDHVPVIQGDKVYLFRRESNSAGGSMKMERYIGMYSDKMEKLMAELDRYTDNKYKLEQKLISQIR